MNEFLPEGYQELNINKSYWNMKDMIQGDNRLRILKRPIAGWIDWKNNKPYRFKSDNKPTSSFDPEKKINPFWSLYVWNYLINKIFILEIIQITVIRQLSKLGNNKEWGDFTNYDISINKSGSNQNTSYQVIPSQPKPLDDFIIQQMNENPVNLEVLFDGGNPWLGTIEQKLPENISNKQGKIISIGDVLNEEEETISSKKEEVISSEDAEALDVIIGDNEQYRKNLNDFLLNSFGAKSISEMPKKIYENIYDRASTVCKKQELPF